MNSELRASYAHCARLTRRAASNFHLTFYMLPRSQRMAMCALYAFLRKTDDLADGPAPADYRRRALELWRQAVEDALEGTIRDPILPALLDTTARYAIPTDCYMAVMEGVAMDLGERRFATFAELKEYCHLVAGVVGLACIRIWGYRHDRALAAAEDCGVAFQLTNVLRDLRDDAARGRIYLPAEDLKRFDCHERDLMAGVCHDPLRRLLAYQISRAEEYFDKARRLHAELYPNGRRIFSAMYATYHELLTRIKARDGDPFGPTIRLPRWRRLMILAGTALPATSLKAP